MLASILAIGIVALVPAEVEATQCFCAPDVRTIRGWGFGGTCAAAKVRCEADARSRAQADCAATEGTSVCAWGAITFQPANCYLDNGYRVDCDQDYRCDACVEFPGP